MHANVHAGIFDDEVFHAGGDEVNFGCWNQNADVRVWMDQQAMNTTGLNNYYMGRLFDIINQTMRKSPMVWRPGASDHGVGIPKDVIFDLYSGPLSMPLPPDGQGGYNVRCVRAHVCMRVRTYVATLAYLDASDGAKTA